MTWFKVDDHLHAHPKALQAGNAALGLWVRAGSWSAQQLTNGFVPDNLARSYGRPRDITALTAAGLWRKVPGGYRFHDWGDFQPADTEVESLRRKRSEAGKAGAAKRWGRPPPDTSSTPTTPSETVANGMANGVANGVLRGVLDGCPDPDPDPVVVVEVVGQVETVGAAAKPGLDLARIAKELHSTIAWALSVADDVLSRAGDAVVTDRTAYVLASIKTEPKRYQPTSQPPPYGHTCPHNRDDRTCRLCAQVVS